MAGEIVENVAVFFSSVMPANAGIHVFLFVTLFSYVMLGPG